MELALSWDAGEHVRFRYVRDGRGFWTLRVTVVADEPRLLALWIAPQTPMRQPVPIGVPIPDLARGRWEPVDTTWFGEGVLMLRRPDRCHAIWLFWEPCGAFRGWYVNLEEWERTEHGVDAHDHLLDIWAHPDGSWHWKDEDDLAETVSVGLCTAEEARAIRTEGERVIAEWPFPTG
jgi:hypothetical protein